jgi:predicted nucleic acid-binding protein
MAVAHAARIAAAQAIRPASPTGPAALCKGTAAQGGAGRIPYVTAPANATFFDASALVKRYVNEKGSPALRVFWKTQATKCTSPFCFYEALRVLKRYKIQKNPKLTKEQYLDAAQDLTDWFRASSSQIPGLDLTKPQVFENTVSVAKSQDFDLSDAFQLVTLQAGAMAKIVGGSVRLLVTADEDLAAAARKMGLRAWDCEREPAPPP